MSTAADNFMLEVDRARALAWEWASDPKRRQRSFWVGLAFAALVHLVAIVGIASAPSRTVGSPDGDKNAISVELVDEATLRDTMAPPTPPASPLPPSESVTQASPPQPQTTPTPPEPPTPPEETAAVEPPTPPAEPQPQETQKPQDVPALSLQPAEEAAQPPPAEKPKQETPKAEPAKPKQAQPKKKTQTALAPNQLDLSVPDMGDTGSEAAGGSSAVQRPPGITKSGENDEFARNVIRALQKSMPYERNANGRVTVRIVLSENGSRADVKLLKSGGDPDLDFNVMFAARQTAYPFPPKNSTVADRTFMVTYIYR